MSDPRSQSKESKVQRQSKERLLTGTSKESKLEGRGEYVSNTVFFDLRPLRIQPIKVPSNAFDPFESFD
jgi:hypothetical protein